MGGGGGRGIRSPQRQTSRQRQTDGETERQGTRQGQGKVESRMACRNVSMKVGSRNSWKEQKGAWLEKAGREEVEASGLRKQAVHLGSARSSGSCSISKNSRTLA